MRTIVFIDGQNLYRLAMSAWGPGYPYHWPSYDVEKLAQTLVALKPGRTLEEIRFYTGVPNQGADPFWHGFWTKKLRHLRNQGIEVYRGRVNTGGQEKGVDVSLALDLVRATYEQRYDASIIVSQDADFAPAVQLSKAIAKAQRRWIDFESAFPFAYGRVSNWGVPGTHWIRMDKTLYDACHDPADYRP